jgi:ParB family chromosome partitioning protein
MPHEVLVSSIVPNPHQPRRSFDDASLAELAASIRSTGLIQPILVRQVGQQYQLIAGERRLRAAKLAGLDSIPVVIRDVDSVTQAQMGLIENIQREDLNPIDRALGYRTLIEQLGLTQAELASRMGEDRSSIANFLRLLDLAEPVRHMVRDGRLSVGHAKLIAGVSDLLEQERLANLVLLQGLSVRNLERLMKEAPKPQQRTSQPPSPHIQDLEKNLARQLGLRVQVRSAAKKGKGKLIIHYASLDQFDELLSRLGVSAE